jgi:hypothetical protein
MNFGLDGDFACIGELRQISPAEMLNLLKNVACPRYA